MITNLKTIKIFNLIYSECSQYFNQYFFTNKLFKSKWKNSFNSGEKYKFSL